MFAHEKLQVYSKALSFTANVMTLVSVWDKKHALVDQFSRAAESVVLNLAEAARLKDAPARLNVSDYAIGSALECAGCLDVARIKGLLKESQCDQEKKRLCEITKMLVGLRKAWGQSLMLEEPVPYQTSPGKPPYSHLFPHEDLDVYKTALGFVYWFAARPEGQALSAPFFRQLDAATTSIVLNIAEGNGRYAEQDHRKFLKIAEQSAVKASAYLDLGVARKLLLEHDVATGKKILWRVNAMLTAM